MIRGVRKKMFRLQKSIEHLKNECANAKKNLADCVVLFSLIILLREQRRNDVLSLSVRPTLLRVSRVGTYN